jgi:hypothetical protein
MNTPRDEFERSLAEEDGTYPESWRPQPGDWISGVVVRYQHGETKFGPYSICVLECRNEEGQPFHLGISFAHAVLRDLFKQQRPRRGERIGVKRLRGHETKGCTRYVLRVDRPDADMPDWNALDDHWRAPERR